MLKRLCAILMLACFTLPLAAQEIEWSIDATVLLNNREGSDEYSPDQTFAFTRLHPEVGVSMNEGEHVLKGGLVWYQPMIDDLTGYKLLPTLYYHARSWSSACRATCGATRWTTASPWCAE